MYPLVRCHGDSGPDLVFNHPKEHNRIVGTRVYCITGTGIMLHVLYIQPDGTTSPYLHTCM